MSHLRLAYIAIALVTVGLSGWFAWSLNAEQTRLRERAQHEAASEAGVAAAAIVTRMRELEEAAEAFAERLTAGELEPADVPTALCLALDDHVIFGAGVAYEPGVLGEDLPPQERSWYAFRRGDGLAIKPKDYEYTDRSQIRNAWYYEPVERRQGVWKEPKFGRTSHTFITGYSLPFFRTPDRSEIAGVVTLNYSLSELHDLMRQISIWDAGYAVIYSQQGNLIYHPDAMVVQNAEIGPDAPATVRKEFPLLCQLAELEGKGAETFVRARDADGQRVWTMTRSIEDTGWHVSLVYYRDEVLSESDRARILKRWLILTGILATISTCFAVLYHSGLTVPKLWGLSAVASAAFIVGVLIIWSHNLGARASGRDAGAKLWNRSQLEEVRQRAHDQAGRLHLPDPVFVPTGTFIRSISFNSANDVVVNGYIWQRYDQALFASPGEDALGEPLPPRLDEKGLVFVEAFESDIDLVEAEKNYSRIDDGVETVVWHFKVTLRQKFGYQQYPFDHEAVWLRLRYVDADKNVILLPDLDAYAMVYEGASPGIDPRDFILPGWELEGTSFTLDEAGRSASLGFHSATMMGATPELYFNIGIQRNFLDPFISNITPVVIIFLILFVVVLSSTADPDRANRFGFNSFAVMGLVAALLFSTMYLHAGLRSQLGSPSVTYFECFYILGYVVMILAAANASLLTSNRRFAWIHRNNNLMPKLLFWPLVSGAVFFITISKLQV